MPLVQGYTPDAISQNISAEVRAGRDQAQAVAIAYSVARRAWRRRHPRARLPDWLRRPPPHLRNPEEHPMKDESIQNPGKAARRLRRVARGRRESYRFDQAVIGRLRRGPFYSYEDREQITRRLARDRRRRRNPTHYDWLDLLIPAGLVLLLVRSGRVQIGR